MSTDEETMVVLLSTLPSGAKWKTALSILEHCAVTKFHDFALGGAVRAKKGKEYEPVPDARPAAYLEELRSKDPATFRSEKDDENKLVLMALIDLVRDHVAEVRKQIFDVHAASAGLGAVSKIEEKKEPQVQQLRSKPASTMPGAPGAAETNARPFKPPWCMLFLLWLYVAGSAGWLKMSTPVPHPMRRHARLRRRPSLSLPLLARSSVLLASLRCC
jgi:hypothetical protein